MEARWRWVDVLVTSLWVWIPLALLMNITTIFGFVQSQVAVDQIVAYLIGSLLVLVGLGLAAALVLKVCRDLLVLAILKRTISSEAGRLAVWQVAIAGASLSFLVYLVILIFSLQGGDPTVWLWQVFFAPLFWGGFSALIAVVNNFRVGRRLADSIAAKNLTDTFE
ncbi:hypothetical protein V0U79_12555 [Hyphobacterium sp. HN65]|uniref:DUF2975 domain-containing protein n=1 Tax=Hyphobacterium lacteum TaxID=3116575 RepID=A0ABU7LTF5_9PROT|nr:hypothetical protein [Hyphobacterium sp. HN65]MEE2527200.1 hypothetical protein [Hyphobacterium sp. HN65]